MMNATRMPTAFAPTYTHWCNQHQVDGDIPQHQERGDTATSEAFDGFLPVGRVAPTYAA